MRTARGMVVCALPEMREWIISRKVRKVLTGGKGEIEGGRGRRGVVAKPRRRTGGRWATRRPVALAELSLSLR
ncbi:hypothetical protein GCM10011395_27060 [Sphingomonas psychrolutea]|uniref:Uncharacterized protein n=1 Tax=Sphingomonas psychrolutea TaxID=1259676 RepID=A0ABQ1H198_9SPHN|nr:hypothetical protein GCM10011395_27060 [Sphingomonas psychrolutea]